MKAALLRNPRELLGLAAGWRRRLLYHDVFPVFQRHSDE
jgi:hypothetical protein